MKSTTFLLSLALLAIPLSGCVENMRDLKDRVGAGEDADAARTESLNETSIAEEINESVVRKPPVARVTVFGANGALVYKSTFQAEDAAEPVFVPEKSKLSLLAADSEAIEAGATLVAWQWTLAGKPLEGGAKAEAELGEAGLYVLTLAVTDSHGNSDNQSVTLAVAPVAFEVVTELLTGPVAGAEGEGVSGSATFELSLADAKVPATISAVRFAATPPLSCDPILEVVGPDGESMGARDEAGNGGEESISGGALPEGAYEIVVSPFACLAPDGVAVTVTVTYVPLIEGLGGDAHGGHAH